MADSLRWLTTIKESETVSPPASNAEGQIFRPIRTVNAFEQLVERLGRAIKLGLLAPGERLPPERRLAEQLELSRSTVREALRLLYDAGYLEARRGRRGGVFVAEQLPTGPAPGMLALDGDGVRDLLAYRRCLELGAASWPRSEPARHRSPSSPP